MNHYAIIVVGAGHAGCEAALAGARMGAQTLLLTISQSTIAQMSCNPAIGGLAKGQLVREIDALGGAMGKVIDATGIQFRMLNTGKGPAVQAPRAQADKAAYQEFMRNLLSSTPGLTVKEEMVDEILVKDDKAIGVTCHSGSIYYGQTIVLTTGTFMKGVIHIGPEQTTGGRVNEPSAEKISDSLRQLGLEIGRLKTGTPPRLDARTLNYDKLTAQPGDPEPIPFSFATKKITRSQIPCWITYTNPETHRIIRSNLDRAPLYTGQIKAVGPRYCPSIETKIERFADRARHQIFLEPEGRDTEWIYCNGLATSIPLDVQDAMVHSISGLEQARILRYGYAIEYDFVLPYQIKPSLETKSIANFFLAGQINGTSGYEEAAAQGIMAGINAALKCQGKAPFMLGRDEAYIGVLIDDLVTLGPTEPYRMFTSQAEYRLLLRSDNADRRLMKYGYQFGLIPEAQFKALQEKEVEITRAKGVLAEKRYQQKPLTVLLKRPEVTWQGLMERVPELVRLNISKSVWQQVQIEIKYEGYIKRQLAEISRMKHLENIKTPPDLDYARISHISNEARQKLMKFRPLTLGQASRIAGVTPADISVLMVHLSRADRSSQNRPAEMIDDGRLSIADCKKTS